MSDLTPRTLGMLAESRFAPHFQLIGDGGTHFGLFEGCGKSIPFDDGPTDDSACC